MTHVVIAKHPKLINYIIKNSVRVIYTFNATIFHNQSNS